MYELRFVMIYFQRVYRKYTNNWDIIITRTIRIYIIIRRNRTDNSDIIIRRNTCTNNSDNNNKNI